jgi:hypothetical protein
VLAQEPPDSESIRVLNKWKDHGLVGMLATVIPVPWISDPDNFYPFRRREILIKAGLAVFTAFVITFLLTLPLVKAAIEDASNGRDVVPLTILGIPTLSIESRPCHALWLGNTPEPEQLRDRTLHCLGSANGTTLFRTSSKTVRVPTSEVVTTFDG